MVEPVDPFEGGVLDVVEAAPGAAVADEIGLIEPDHRLREGVIVGVGELDRASPGSPSPALADAASALLELGWVDR